MSLIGCDTEGRKKIHYFKDYWCKQVHDMNTQHSQKPITKGD